MAPLQKAYYDQAAGMKSHECSIILLVYFLVMLKTGRFRFNRCHGITSDKKIGKLRMTRPALFIRAEVTRKSLEHVFRPIINGIHSQTAINDSSDLHPVIVPVGGNANFFYW